MVIYGRQEISLTGDRNSKIPQLLTSLWFEWLCYMNHHSNCYCLHFNSLNVWNVNVCVKSEGGGFLLPCQYFYLLFYFSLFIYIPHFKISFASSQEISKWLFRDSTLRCVAHHSSQASENCHGLKDGWGSNNPRGLSTLWQILTPEAPTPCLWTHKYKRNLEKIWCWSDIYARFS